MTWRSSAIQSVAFRRDAGWTETRARSWLADHGHEAPAADTTPRYLRFRQRSPEGFSVMRWLPLSEREGIYAVIGRPTNPGDTVEPGDVAWETEAAGARFALLRLELEPGWIGYSLIADGEPVLDAILPDTVDVEAAIGDLALPWIALWQGGGS